MEVFAVQILGNRRFVEIPGTRTHELPPLLIGALTGSPRAEKTLELAEELVDQEGLIPMAAEEAALAGPVFEQRRLDLAIQIVEQYYGLLSHWKLGDAILEWIRQCEQTFEQRQELRPLLRPDIWPHAGRSSFVTLLRDKAVDTRGLDPEKAVGTRLSFRQPPPLEVVTDQFLFYLRSTLAQAAYQAWASLTPEPISALPPERFTFEVHTI
jgi:hypothetical protein